MKIRSIVFCLIVLASSPARAQIPVTDLIGWAEQVFIHVERVQHYVEIYSKWKRQFEEWKKQYEALNGQWDAITQGNLDPAIMAALRETMPPELQDFMDQQGGGALFGDMQADFQRLRSQISSLPPDFYPHASELSDNLEKALDTIAIEQATADTAYRAAQENVTTAKSLGNKVRSAGTLKNVTDLNARINAELLATQAEANRLRAFAIRKEADEKRDSQKQIEAFAEAMQRTTPLVRY